MNPTEAVVALGSNLGLPKAQLTQAVDSLKAEPSITGFQLSRWYRSAPVGGPADQPDYLNAVCRFQTTLTPSALLALCHRLEQAAERKRDVRWGPRTLDLDIILYGDIVSDDPNLTLPHPRAHERAFVLLPLQDIAPEIILADQPLDYWLNGVNHQEITPILACG